MLSNGSGFHKSIVTFGVDMSSSVYIDIKKKNVLIIVKGSTDGLDDIILIAEEEYSLNFTEQQNNYPQVYTIMG